MSDQPSKNDPTLSLLLPIKVEPNVTAIKIEPCNPGKMHLVGSTDKLKTRQFREHGHDIIEILSDSEADMEEEDGFGDGKLNMVKGDAGSGWESEPCSLPPPSDGEGFNSEVALDSQGDDSDDDSILKEFDPMDFIFPSDTQWHDPKVTSTVIKQKTHVTSSLTVKHIEYLTVIPSLWPIPKIPTAFIVDLCDPNYKIFHSDGILYSPDALIKNKASC
ncbi:hypothetical protein C0992_001483 [Termitomyces sp. T32_za158]|nr:hypothetical protein C0992_001483 [Termitomyces sp. T32_za158]